MDQNANLARYSKSLHSLLLKDNLPGTILHKMSNFFKYYAVLKMPGDNGGKKGDREKDRDRKRSLLFILLYTKSGV